jgi:hypothetical protein
MAKLLSRALVGIGYLLVAFGAILPPLAYALDHLDTLPAIAIALGVIACGAGIVIAGDRVSDTQGSASGQPRPPAETVPKPETRSAKL